jgi:lactate permease
MAGPPLTFSMWLLAASPLGTILGLMLWARWSGARAGGAGLGVALAVAWFAFGAGPHVLLAAAFNGGMLALYVLYIIWPALVLYHIVDEAGAIRSIGLGVARLTQDHILQLLILGFAFSTFLQGVAAFGIPVAVVSPLLIALGFPPIQSTVVPLVGHAWSVTMGGLAASFQALVGVTGLAPHRLGLWTAAFLGVACVLTAFLVAHVHAGMRPIRRCFGAILVLSGAMGATQFLLAYLDYWIIASLAAGIVGLGISLLIGRLSSRPRAWHAWGVFPRWQTRRILGGPRDHGLEALGLNPSDLPPAAMGFHLAFSPYYALVGITGTIALVPSLAAWLERASFYVRFDETLTAYHWATRAGSYHIRPLTHPGGILILTTLAAYAIVRASGHWRPGTGRLVARQTVAEAVPTSIGILAMVLMALVMVYSGMTFLLARGTHAVAGGLYPLLAPFVGLLGCFMTGSNTNSNILFGAFQRDIAGLLGANPALMAALQTTGGALGSMIAPAKVLVACATAGLSGREGQVMATALKYCLPLVAMVGVAGWVLVQVAR